MDNYKLKMCLTSGAKVLEFSCDIPQDMLVPNPYENGENKEISYQLPDKFIFKNEHAKASRLDPQQVALLFNLFRDAGVIAQYNNPSLAKMVHYLTGIGERNAEKNISNYQKINEMLTFKNGKVSSENIDEITDVLLKTKQEIDALLTVCLLHKQKAEEKKNAANK